VLSAPPVILACLATLQGCAWSSAIGEGPARIEAHAICVPAAPVEGHQQWRCSAKRIVQFRVVF